MSDLVVDSIVFAQSPRARTRFYQSAHEKEGQKVSSGAPWI